MSRTVRIVRSTLPDYRTVCRQLIKEFMPQAARTIRRTAMNKIGHYQPGWPPLAPSTKRKKRQSLRRMGRRAPWMRFSAPTADKPLIDTGKMGNAINGYARGNKAHVSAPFPMNVHEQDPEMEMISNSIHTPPRRAVLGPSLEESLDPIVRDLEAYVGQRL